MKKEFHQLDIKHHDFISALNKLIEDIKDISFDIDGNFDFNSNLINQKIKYPTEKDRIEAIYENQVRHPFKKGADAITTFKSIINSCILTIIEIREQVSNDQVKASFDYFVTLAILLGQLNNYWSYVLLNQKIKYSSHAAIKKNDAKNELQIEIIKLISQEVGSKKFKSINKILDSISTTKIIDVLSAFESYCNKKGKSYPIPKDYNLGLTIKRWADSSKEFKKEIGIYLEE